MRKPVRHCMWGGSVLLMIGVAIGTPDFVISLDRSTDCWNGSAVPLQLALTHALPRVSVSAKEKHFCDNTALTFLCGVLKTEAPNLG